jgi:hypothetical protein
VSAYCQVCKESISKLNSMVKEDVICFVFSKNNYDYIKFKQNYSHNIKTYQLPKEFILKHKIDIYPTFISVDFNGRINKISHTL